MTPGRDGGPPLLASAGTAVAPEDRPTFEDLYHAHRLSLVRLAMLLVDDQALAEDLVQDAFAALHLRWGRLAEPHRALGYVRVSVVNGARSALRRRRLARGQPPAPDEPVPSPEREAVLAENQREVMAALRALPERQRQVLVLRYWAELSEAEIAQALGISRGTVKSSASRGLDRLETMLEGVR